ncbi:hypothetical protein MMC12_008685, partial [Toensbergia leucococca]|nr:hypothetical protein [Toensbergia leucococca]
MASHTVSRSEDQASRPPQGNHDNDALPKTNVEFRAYIPQEVPRARKRAQKPSAQSQNRKEHPVWVVKVSDLSHHGSLLGKRAKSGPEVAEVEPNFSPHVDTGRVIEPQHHPDGTWSQFPPGHE